MLDYSTREMLAANANDSTLQWQLLILFVFIILEVALVISYVSNDGVCEHPDDPHGDRYLPVIVIFAGGIVTLLIKILFECI